MTLPPAARYVVSYLRLFPIWRYGELYDLDGRYYAKGWYPERFGTREITKAEAERLAR